MNDLHTNIRNIFSFMCSKFTITNNSGMMKKFSDLEVRDMIVKNLMREYSHQEIVPMLDSAKIKRYTDKVVVTYSNNKVDVFYANCSIELLHSSQLKGN